MTTASLPPPTVIEQYALVPETLRPLTGGLINTSFRIRRTNGTDCTLQRVNPIFSTHIHADIDAVTRHLDKKDLITPLLIPTSDDLLFVRTDDETWRLLSWVEGNCIESISNDHEAAEAGRILGQFHAALADYTAPLNNRRAGVHDLPRHLQALQATLAKKTDHPAHTKIAELARQIDDLAQTIGPIPQHQARLVHGDPKISNVVFRDDHAVCLIDLDTLARMPVALELGDAFRSWCNIAAEDSLESAFSIERFRATLEGYGNGAGNLLAAAERDSLAEATLMIAMELAARFAADALNESYFGWDRDRFESASKHNYQRAASQLALARSIHGQLRELHQAAMTLL